MEIGDKLPLLPPCEKAVFWEEVLAKIAPYTFILHKKMSIIFEGAARQLYSLKAS